MPKKKIILWALSMAAVIGGFSNPPSQARLPLYLYPQLLSRRRLIRRADSSARIAIMSLEDLACILPRLWKSGEVWLKQPAKTKLLCQVKRPAGWSNTTSVT